MKNRKVLLGLVLMVAVLVLGVVYAALTEELEITGSASAIVSDSNFVVKFTDDEITKTVSSVNNAGENAAAITATKTNDLEATINVSNLTAKGDYATATYTIENASADLSASLVATTSNTNTEYFAVTTEGITGTPTVVKAGDTTTITVKVELVKTPTDAAENDDTVTVTIAATSVQPTVNP